MSVDIPAFLGATSGAIPTLLLALVLQRPLLMGLIKVADMYRAGVDDLKGYTIGRFLLRLAPVGASGVARNFDYFVIAVGVVGMVTSVVLQAVPSREWLVGGSWHGAVGLVFWGHAGAVLLLALAVGSGLVVVTRGARDGEEIGTGEETG